MKDRVKKFFWMGGVAIIALQMYFVRELIAALALVGVVFSAFAVLVLALNAMQWAYGFAFARAESYVRNGEAQDGFSRKQLRRQRSLTAR